MRLDNSPIKYTNAGLGLLSKFVVSAVVSAEDFLDSFVLALWNRKLEKNQILKKFKNSRNSKHSNLQKIPKIQISDF